MDDRDAQEESAATSVNVTDATQHNARLMESDVNHGRVSSGCTRWDSYRFPQNIKVEDKLEESMEDDSQLSHSADGHARTDLESMVYEEEHNEQERGTPKRSRDQLPTWTHGANDAVMVKQELDIDDYDGSGDDGEDARRWFVCEAGELREVTAGQTEAVSPSHVDDACDEDADETSATDTNNHKTQLEVRSAAGPSHGTPSAKSRRLRIYERSGPRATVHRDLSTDDFSMIAQLAQKSRQKKYAKRNELTLQNKLDLIKAAAESGKSSRQLAHEFHIGRTQACRILKRKSELLREIEQTNCPNRKRGLQKTANKDVNVICWEWFQTARSLNIPVTGTMLQEKALRCARHLGNTDFKASNGWLESFRRRHGISFSMKCADACKAEDMTKSNDAELLQRTSSDDPLATESQECDDGNRPRDLETADVEPGGAGVQEARCLISSDVDALKWVGELTKYGQRTNDTVLCNMASEMKAYLKEKLSGRQDCIDDS